MLVYNLFNFLLLLIKISIASMKKNFSIAKLYSDLEKYETNLNGIKDSRLKKQASGTSFYQRPSSTHKTYEPRESFLCSKVARFDKTKLEVGSHKRHARETFEKYGQSNKNSIFECEFEGNQNNSVLREKSVANNSQSKQNLIAKTKFDKNDELYFLSECNKLYNIKSKSGDEEADSVKRLVNQINKRDKVYDAVTKIFGREDTERKFEEFLAGHEKMKRIIAQFKRMSKLTMNDDEQLYNFLVNPDE